jgi:hypothetical protein
MEGRSKKKTVSKEWTSSYMGKKGQVKKMEQSILWFVGFDISLKLHSCTLHLQINLNLKILPSEKILKVI